MAAPGSPLDPRSRGGNALIKMGAALIEGAEDIAQHLGAAPRSLRPSGVAPLFEFEENIRSGHEDLTRLARLLSPTPIHLNELARLADMTPAAAAAGLVELELEGRAASPPGGFAATAGAAFGA